MIAKGAEVNPQIASKIPTIEAQLIDVFTILKIYYTNQVNNQFKFAINNAVEIANKINFEVFVDFLLVKQFIKEKIIASNGKKTCKLCRVINT